METLTCTKCGQEKSTDDFYPDTGRRKGFYPSCRKCTKETVTAWRRQNPEKTAEYNLSGFLLRQRLLYTAIGKLSTPALLDSARNYLAG